MWTLDSNHELLHEMWLQKTQDNFKQKNRYQMFLDNGTFITTVHQI